MSVKEKLLWKAWADGLRQSLMKELTLHVTKSVDQIIEETATEKSATVLGTQKYWQACQAGTGTNDTLSKAGFEMEFAPNPDGKVDNVTFTLNGTWQGIMQRGVDRRSDKARH